MKIKEIKKLNRKNFKNYFTLLDIPREEKKTRKRCIEIILF
jgi:hypothetical protein